MLQGQLIGRFTANPEVQYLPSGTAFARFNLAVQDDYYDKKQEGWVERAYFFTFKAWGKTAESIANKYGKGDPVLVDFKPTQEKWEDKEGEKRSTIIFEVRHVTDLSRYSKRGGPKKEASDYQKPPKKQSAPPPPFSAGGDDFDEDDIPF